MVFAKFKFSEDPKLSPVASNWNVLFPSPDTIVIPPPSAAASFAAPVPNSRFLSSTVIVVEFTVVVVPSIWRLPAITTVPVLSPIAAGSIVNVDGPVIVFVEILIPVPLAPVDKDVANKVPVTVAPVEVVSNFLELS